MKRAMFIILWAVVFFVVTLILGSICLPILCKLEGWKFPVMPLGVTEIWAVISIGSPLVGLSLGSRGLLPGTKKNKKS
jgi:uncharacterized membrane protein SpoIIM required for sporulation